MSKFKIEIRNADLIVKELVNSSPKMRKQINQVAKNTAEKGMVIAKRYAPKDTHFLKDNIVTGYEGKDVMIHSKAYYSGFQEWGTRFQSGTPFMRPMIKDILPQYQKGLEDVGRGLFK